MKPKTTLALAAMLGLFAGLNDGPVKTEQPKSSNKMPLDEDEKSHLATLSGKNKKIYIKKLKEKYAGQK